MKSEALPSSWKELSSKNIICILYLIVAVLSFIVLIVLVVWNDQGSIALVLFSNGLHNGLLYTHQQQSMKGKAQQNTENDKMFSSCQNANTLDLPRLQSLQRWHSRHVREDQSITLMTQLSIDRMDLLESQCMYWPDRFAAAVYIPYISAVGIVSYGLDTMQPITGTSDAVVREKTSKNTHEQKKGNRNNSNSNNTSGASYRTLFEDIAAAQEYFSGFHERMEMHARCRLDLELVVQEFESLNDPKLGMYPFNAMRNRAMTLVQTDLVVLLDVDFLPALSLVESYYNFSGGYHLLHTALMQEPTILILPAFEYIGSEVNTTSENANPSENTKSKKKNGKNNKKDAHLNRSEYIAAARSATLPLLESKAALVKAYRNGELLAFHIKSYAPGHTPTNYSNWIHSLSTNKDHDRWKTFVRDMTRYYGQADSSVQKKWVVELQRSFGSYTYDVDWKEGFEPFAVMAKKYVPWYDERFYGFGHDKVVHIAFLSIQLGAHFIVHPTAYVIHLPHPKAPTVAISRENGHWDRAHALYSEVKLQMKNGTYVPVVTLDEQCSLP